MGSGCPGRPVDGVGLVVGVVMAGRWLRVRWGSLGVVHVVVMR